MSMQPRTGLRSMESIDVPLPVRSGSNASGDDSSGGSSGKKLAANGPHANQAADNSTQKTGCANSRRRRITAAGYARRAPPTPSTQRERSHRPHTTMLRCEPGQRCHWGPESGRPTSPSRGRNARFDTCIVWHNVDVWTDGAHEQNH